MSKTKPILKKVVSYGYVGTWLDGTLGWSMPKHLVIHDTKERPDPPTNRHDWAKGEPGYLCKITIEPILKRKKGEPLLKRKLK